jgi:crotonobetaine/carnitine-CoA ligase
MAENDPLILANLVAARAASDPDFDVLTFEGGGVRNDEVRTYRELWENGQRLAAALVEAGMQKGDRFGLLMQNHPEFVEAMVAASITGTVFVPIDPRIGPNVLAYMLKDSGCRGLICADYALQTIASSNARTKLEWVFVVGEQWRVQWDDLPTRPLAEALSVQRTELTVHTSDLTDPMQIMYTSGTTGDPKGIVVRNARFCAVLAHGETVFGLRSDDRPYTGLSLTHGNAQFVTLASSLNMKLRAVFSRKFTKSRLWDITRKYGCTVFNLLGGMATAVYSEPPRPDDADNPIRLVISAGMPAAVWEAFERRFNVKIIEFYGAVEGGLAFNRGDGPKGSCGRVAPGLEAKVVDDDGEPCPPNVPGEIWFRPENGNPPVVEYFNNPDASRRKTEGGWLHSGDVVRMDEQGWIFFEYRKGGGIRRNGEFVNTAFIEKVIAEHPSVSDVYVYGIPSTTGAPGEKEVVAAVVPRSHTAFDPLGVFQTCQEKLEKHWVPSQLQLVKEIPKTASEKPQERFLLQMLTNGASIVIRCPTTRYIADSPHTESKGA